MKRNARVRSNFNLRTNLQLPGVSENWTSLIGLQTKGVFFM